MQAKWVTAFRRIGLPALIARAIILGLAASLVGLLTYPAIHLAPGFIREARTLLALERNGVRVPLASVRDVERIDRADTTLVELSYSFAPDLATAEPWEPPRPSLDSAEEIDAFIARLRAPEPGRLPRGWHRGRSLLSRAAADAIAEDPSWQFVTHLPDDPGVNALGPITGKRIWFTWSGAGDDAMLSLIAVGAASVLAIGFAIQRFRRRARGGPSPQRLQG